MKQPERPALHRWTRREYARLIAHGFFDEDDPIELLDGLLLIKEPQSSPHRTAVLWSLARWSARSATAGSFRRRVRSASTFGPSPSPTSASFAARCVTTPTPIRHARSSSWRSRSRAWPWRAEGRRRRTRVAASRTTGSSISSTACSRSIASQRRLARRADAGATRRSSGSAPTPPSRHAPHRPRASPSPISCRSSPRRPRQHLRRLLLHHRALEEVGIDLAPEAHGVGEHEVAEVVLAQQSVLDQLVGLGEDLGHVGDVH